MWLISFLVTLIKKNFYLDPLITVVSTSRNVSSLFIRIIVKTSLSWVEKPTFGAKTVMLKKLLDSVLALLCRQELWWILPTSAGCKVKIKTFCYSQIDFDNSQNQFRHLLTKSQGNYSIRFHKSWIERYTRVSACHILSVQ